MYTVQWKETFDETIVVNFLSDSKPKMSIPLRGSPVTILLLFVGFGLFVSIGEIVNRDVYLIMELMVALEVIKLFEKVIERGREKRGGDGIHVFNK